MKTINDTLSFEDIQVYDDMLIDSVAEAASMDGPQIAAFINKERPELIARWIHNFLEWDTCPEFNCCFGDEFVQHSKDERVQPSGFNCRCGASCR